MSTFVNIGLDSLDKRFEEIRMLLNEAKQNVDTKPDLYNAICRSTQVLLSAHLEGYIRDLIKYLLDDLNHHSDFKSANEKLKRRACEYYIFQKGEEPNTDKVNAKVKELITVFEELNLKFKKEFFVLSDNENPKASVLEKAAKQFGIKNLFKELLKSNLDLAFSNTNAANNKLSKSLKKTILRGTKSYPYTINLDFLEIDVEKPVTDNLWEAFLSDLLKRRHDIAHGNEMDNVAGHTIIEGDLLKLEILVYAFTAFFCYSVLPK